MSFAYIVYMSAWLKYHWPTETLAGLLNAQPMGFYSPNSLVQDAAPARGGELWLRVSTARSTTARSKDGRSIQTTRSPTTERAGGGAGGLSRIRLRPAMAVRLGLALCPQPRGERHRSDRSRPSDRGRVHEPRGRRVSHRVVGASSRRSGGQWSVGDPLGIERRAGMWAAGPLSEIDPERLPLSPGIEAPPLPGMTAEEEHRADLWSTGVSNTHPIQFIRDELQLPRDV